MIKEKWYFKRFRLTGATSIHQLAILAIPQNTFWTGCISIHFKKATIYLMSVIEYERSKNSLVLLNFSFQPIVAKFANCYQHIWLRIKVLTNWRNDISSTYHFVNSAYQLSILQQPFWTGNVLINLKIKL